MGDIKDVNDINAEAERCDSNYFDCDKCRCQCHINRRNDITWQFKYAHPNCTMRLSKGETFHKAIDMTTGQTHDQLLKFAKEQDINSTEEFSLLQTIGRFIMNLVIIGERLVGNLKKDFEAIKKMVEKFYKSKASDRKDRIFYMLDQIQAA